MAAIGQSFTVKAALILCRVSNIPGVVGGVDRVQIGTLMKYEVKDSRRVKI